MTDFETIVSTRRSFLATSAAAGAACLLGLTSSSDAQAVYSSPSSIKPRTATGEASIRSFRIEQGEVREEPVVDRT